jgi:hypothetical protein
MNQEKSVKIPASPGPMIYCKYQQTSLKDSFLKSKVD